MGAESEVTLKVSRAARQKLREQKGIGVSYSQVILKLAAIREEHLQCPDVSMKPARHEED